MTEPDDQQQDQEQDDTPDDELDPQKLADAVIARRGY